MVSYEVISLITVKQFYDNCVNLMRWFNNFYTLRRDLIKGEPFFPSFGVINICEYVISFDQRRIMLCKKVPKFLKFPISTLHSAKN